MPALSSWLFGCDMLALLGGRAFHNKDQERQPDCDHGKDQESVEVGKRRGLLFPEIFERLQSHLVGGSRISGLLEKGSVRLVKIGIHGGVE